MAETRDLPLLRWGEALRAAQHLKRKMRLRLVATSLAATVVGATLTSVFWSPRPILVWNLTESSPIGLYAVSDPSDLQVGDMVVAWPPAAGRQLGAERHYIPANVPLIKPIAATAGDHVCAIGESIFVNRRPLATRRQSDGVGRPMPWWEGCLQLRAGEVFLLSADAPAAFDGRYFGISSPGTIIGRAGLLWRP